VDNHRYLAFSLGILFWISILYLANFPELQTVSQTGWEKTVTWLDGTKETIQITDKGQVILNGEYIKPFGFCGLCWLDMADAEFENIMNWFDQKGVRFFETAFLTTYFDNQKFMMDKYFPKLKAHKKFVRLGIINPTPTQYDFDADFWETGFKTLIDYIDSKGWGDMMISVQITHEIEHRAMRTGKTVQQLKDFLDTMNQRAKAKLATKTWGNIPVIHAEDGITKDWETDKPYHVALIERTDVILNDFYSVQSEANIDKFLTWHRERYKEAGKDTSQGYKIWYETGYSVPTDNDNYSPELFTYLLNQFDTGDLYLWHLSKKYQDSTTWASYQEWWFREGGVAEPWTEKLAPYFPKENDC